MIYQPIPEKRCSRCRDYKSVFDFYPSKGYLYGIGANCKPCVKIISHEYYLKGKEKAKQRAKEWSAKNPEKRRVIENKYHASHKEQEGAYTKKWRKENPEKTIAAQRRHDAKPERIEKRRKNRRNHYNTHRESERLNNQQWYKLNPVRARIKVHNRRARVRGLPATFTDEQEIVARQYFEGRCAICGRLPDFWHFIALDHWIAVTDLRPDNPGTVADNIIPMCHSKKRRPY